MSLFKSTFTVACMTFISRVTGLVRETIIASYFGAGAGMDAFLVAFKIPNFFRRLFAEGSFTQAFVPVLSQVKTTQTEVEVRHLIERVSGTLGLIVLLFSLLGSILSPLVVTVFAPGFWGDPERFELSAQMLRITFPYLFFITMTALSAGVLNTFHRYAIPAFTPALLNIVFIAFIYGLAPFFDRPIDILSWSVIAGGLVQMLFQLPFMWKIGCLLWPKWGFSNPMVRKIVTLMIPTLIGGSVVQISLMLDTWFASYLQVGSLSWLYFADRLLQFPLAIIGVALSTVLLPHLSSHHAKGNTEDFIQILHWGFRLIVLIVIPASVGLMVLAGPLVITLYQYGHFSAQDAWMCQQALMAYAAGLLFFIGARVLTTACYSQQDMKMPVKIAMGCLACNVLFNFTLTPIFAHTGLAIATSLSSLLNVFALTLLLRRRKLLAFKKIGLSASLRMVLGSFFMGLILWSVQGNFASWLAATWKLRALRLSGLILLGFFVYAASLWMLGIRPHHFVLQISRRSQSEPFNT